MNFDFDPTMWFVCRPCRQIFPDTDTLKEHKLESHLQDCLGMKCIIFEERFVDEDCIPPDLKLPASNKTPKIFVNPYVSLTKLTSQELESALKNARCNKSKGMKLTLRKTTLKTSTKQKQVQNNAQVEENISEPNDKYCAEKFRASDTRSEISLPLIEPEPPLSLSFNNTNTCIKYEIDPNQDPTDDNLVTGDVPYITDISATCKLEEYILPNEQDLTTSIINREYSEPESEPFNIKSEFNMSANFRVEFNEFFNPVDEEQEQLQSYSNLHLQTDTNINYVPPNSQEVSKPFMCSICHNSFRRMEYLRRHMKTHSEDRPFKCPHCPASYKFKTYLKQHLITHGVDTCHKCRYCGKSFFAQNRLADHERTHTGDRPFQCQVENCKAAFTSGDILNKHIRGVHFKLLGLQHCVCRICGKSFGLKSQLNNHSRSVHNLVD